MESFAPRAVTGTKSQELPGVQRGVGRDGRGGRGGGGRDGRGLLLKESGLRASCFLTSFT